MYANKNGTPNLMRLTLMDPMVKSIDMNNSSLISSFLFLFYPHLNQQYQIIALSRISEVLIQAERQEKCSTKDRISQKKKHQSEQHKKIDNCQCAKVHLFVDKIKSLIVVFNIILPAGLFNCFCLQKQIPA